MAQRLGTFLGELESLAKMKGEVEARRLNLDHYSQKMSQLRIAREKVNAKGRVSHARAG